MYRLTLFFTLILLILIVWVIYMANTGQNSVVFDIWRTVPYFDKIAHLLLFGALAFGINFSSKLTVVNIGRLNIYLGTLVVTVFISIEELSQYFIITRSLDVVDFLAGVLGVLIFTVLTQVLEHRGMRVRRRFPFR